jgi:SnoaL-like protein
LSAGTDRDAVDRYVAAMASNDLDARDAVLADDAIEVYPRSGDRFRGRENLRAIIEDYPGGDRMSPPAIDDLIGSQDRWVMTPLFTAVKVSGGGEAYTVVGRIGYPSGEEWHLIQLLRVRGGHITHLTSYFTPPFEPAERRARYCEPG